MKSIAAVFILCTVCLLYGCAKKEKLDTREKTVAAIQKDRSFTEYIQHKTALLQGLAYDEWDLSMGKIESLKQDNSPIQNKSELTHLYKQYGLPNRFTELIENISTASYQLKRKYELYKYPDAWKELNEAIYASVKPDEKRMKKAWGVREAVPGAVGCKQKNLPLVAKNWESRSKLALKQFWLRIGEYCRAASAHKNRDYAQSAKSSMDCRLLSVRHIIQNLETAARSHNQLLQMINCD